MHTSVSTHIYNTFKRNEDPSLRYYHGPLPERKSKTQTSHCSRIVALSSNLTEKEAQTLDRCLQYGEINSNLTEGGVDQKLGRMTVRYK